ncbi:hypothetical protein D3C87_2160690 [compost metagenome]
MNAVCGRRTAPSRLARSARYFRALSLVLSIVPLDVTNTTTPPGFTRSRVLAKK